MNAAEGNYEGATSRCSSLARVALLRLSLLFALGLFCSDTMNQQHSYDSEDEM